MAFGGLQLPLSDSFMNVSIEYYQTLQPIYILVHEINVQSNKIWIFHFDSV